MIFTKRCLRGIWGLDARIIHQQQIREAEVAQTNSLGFVVVLINAVLRCNKTSRHFVARKCSTIRQPTLGNSKFLITKGCYGKRISPPFLQDFKRNWIQVLTVMVSVWFRLLLGMIWSFRHSYVILKNKVKHVRQLFVLMAVLDMQGPCIFLCLIYTQWWHHLCLIVRLPHQHRNSQRQSDGRCRKKMQKYAAAAVQGRVCDCKSRPLVEPKTKREIKTEQRWNEMLQRWESFHVTVTTAHPLFPDLPS